MKQRGGRAGAAGRVDLDWRAVEDRLWPNQREALGRLDLYLTNDTGRASLVYMPTGSGKTVIIALLARQQAHRTGKAALVVSPSAELSDQLKRDLSTGVWERLGLGVPWSAVVVESLLLSNAEVLRRRLAVRDDRATLIVGTLTALTDIRGYDPDLYRLLAQASSLVVVDEGHREPARRWSESAEQLNLPVVLFSATPYRNDVRLFRVDHEHIIYKSFAWAVEQRLIRNVRFETLDGPRDAGGFARSAARRFAELIDQHRVRDDAKAILRFDSQETLDAAVGALQVDERALALGFVAVHEQFKAGDPLKLRSLPNLRARPERLFLHQFKLTEGIDEPRCSVLFLHSDFGNERTLVQQVGRCLRRVQPGEEEPDALVFTTPYSRSAASWAAYRAFDEAMAANGGVLIFLETQYARLLRDLDVAAEYSGRKFRLSPPAELWERLIAPGPEDETYAELQREVLQDLVLPRRCQVYQVDPDREFDELVGNALDNLPDERTVIASARPFPDDNPELHAIVCHVIEPSRFFDRYSFVENRYTATVLLRIGERLFLFDSGRLEMDGLDGLIASELRKLLPRGETTRITMTATRNMDLSGHAVRSRTIEAASLDDTPPSLTDFLSVLSRARGRVGPAGNIVRRYLGLINSRVSDDRSAYIDLPEFAEWCRSLVTDLDANARPAELFDRYLQPLEPPNDPVPRNILLDVTDLDQEFHDGNGEDFHVEDYCSDVVENDTGEHGDCQWRFDVGTDRQENGAHGIVHCFLKFDALRKRFDVRSDALAQYVSDGDGPISVIDFLNTEQRFRIILEGGSAYAFRDFFQLSMSEAMKSVADQLLVSDPALANMVSEKGNNAIPGEGWDDDSVFGYIDREEGRLRIAGTLADEWDGLICDDMAGELADFVAYREDPAAVAFFHAKRPMDPHEISAAALHDVLAQGVKNLDRLRIGGGGIPDGRAATWNRNWHEEQRRIPRIRLGPQRGAQHVDNLRRLLQSATTRRHVCIVLARSLRKHALMRQLRSQNPSAVSIQALLQLVAFHFSVSSVGAIPTVLCD